MREWYLKKYSDNCTYYIHEYEDTNIFYWILYDTVRQYTVKAGEYFNSYSEALKDFEENIGDINQ